MDHIEQTRSVLLLNDANVAVKLKKCIFFTRQTEYLGRVIRSGKFEAENCTTKFISKLQGSTTVTRLCSIFRLLHFLDSSCITLWKSRHRSKTDSEKQNSRSLGLLPNSVYKIWKRFGRTSVLQPVLALQKGHAQYKLDPDAYDRQVCCVLLKNLNDEKNIYWLLVSNCYRERKDSRYDALRLSCINLDSVISSPIFERMPIHPKARSTCAAGCHYSARCNGRTSPSTTKIMRTWFWERLNHSWKICHGRCSGSIRTGPTKIADIFA